MANWAPPCRVLVDHVSEWYALEMRWSSSIFCWGMWYKHIWKTLFTLQGDFFQQHFGMKPRNISFPHRNFSCHGSSAGQVFAWFHRLSLLGRSLTLNPQRRVVLWKFQIPFWARTCWGHLGDMFSFSGEGPACEVKKQVPLDWQVLSVIVRNKT